MKDKILQVINKYARNYYTHGIDGYDYLIFEHDFDYLAKDIEKLFKDIKKQNMKTEELKKMLQYHENCIKKLDAILMNEKTLISLKNSAEYYEKRGILTDKDVNRMKVLSAYIKRQKTNYLNLQP